MVWDEFNLRTLPYGNLLKLMQGRPMQLPQKGGHAKRADNQLIYMTSNLSLQQHICARFRSEANREHARLNLRARIKEVRVPENHALFILLRLIVARDSYEASV